MDEAERRVGEPNPILGTAFGLEDVRSVRDEVLVAGGANLAEVRPVDLLWDGSPC